MLDSLKDDIRRYWFSTFQRTFYTLVFHVQCIVFGESAIRGFITNLERILTVLVKRSGKTSGFVPISGEESMGIRTQIWSLILV